MADFSSYYVADLRLAILQLLAASKCETNVSILKASIAEATPHQPAGDQVRQELIWLDERGLVVKRAIGATVSAATITERGEDVAYGRDTVTGIASPEPG